MAKDILTVGPDGCPLAEDFLTVAIECGAVGTVEITGGSVVGSTLVLEASTGTVNIPLTGVEAAINFSNLNPLQKQALTECIDFDQLTAAQEMALLGRIRGDLIADSLGNPAGYLVKL